MASRYLKAAIPQAQSVYTPMPLNFINQKLELDQQNLDLTGAKLGELNAKPIGLQTVEDELQRDYAVDDYEKAVNWANQFNTSVDEAVQNLYKTGDVSKAVGNIRKLNKDYLFANSEQGVIGINKARKESYENLRKGLADVKNLPNSYWRSLPYLQELEKLKDTKNYPNYVPSKDVAYSDYVDRIESTNKIMTGVADELFGDPQAFTTGKYIIESKRYGVTEDKIKKTFENGLLGNTELMSDIENQITYEYLRNPTDEDFDNYYQRRFSEEADKLYNVALKYKKELGDKSMKADSHWEYEQEHPKGLTISRPTEGTTVTLKTVGEWKNNLKELNNQYETASDNSRKIALDALNKLGITDIQTQQLLQANRNRLLNSDGSLNVQLFTSLTNGKIPVENLGNIEHEIRIYNEALNGEKSLLRQKNNIESRVNDIQNNVMKELEITDTELDNTFNISKYFLYSQGIKDFNSFKQAFKNGTLSLSGIGAGYIIPVPDVLKYLYTEYTDKVDNQKMSFDASYQVADNTDNKTGFGQINDALTKFGQENPLLLLDLPVDGTGKTVKDMLTLEDLKKINKGEIDIKDIITPLNISGKNGAMLYIKREGKEPLQFPIDITSFDQQPLEKAYNNAYRDLASLENRDPSEEREMVLYSTKKGNIVAGDQIYNAEIYSMPLRQPVEITTTQGATYVIVADEVGGQRYYTLSVKDSNGKLRSTGETYTEENSIIEDIGRDAFAIDGIITK